MMSVGCMFLFQKQALSSYSRERGSPRRKMPMDSDTPMAARLERFLAELAPELGATVTSISPISGGYSRVTSVAQIRREDGAEPKLVLRSDPPSGHGVFNSD